MTAAALQERRKRCASVRHLTQIGPAVGPGGRSTDYRHCTVWPKLRQLDVYRKALCLESAFKLTPIRFIEYMPDKLHDFGAFHD